MVDSFSGVRERQPVMVRTLLLLLLLTLGSACTGPVVKVPPDAQGGIEVIGKEKSRAEEWAAILKSRWSPKSKQYQKGAELYIEAKSSFDGWIDRLELDLRANQESSTYKQKLEEAAKKSDAFVTYVRDLPAPGEVAAQAVKPGVFKEIIAGLIAGGLDIWKAWKALEKERREEVIKLLRGLKWKSFLEIKAAK